MLPSRSFSNDPNFNTNTGKPTTTGYTGLTKAVPDTAGNYLYQYTTDGGAGGAEILDWYENNKEQIQQFKQEVISCEICGCQLSRDSLKRHQSTIKCKKAIC